MTIQYDGSFFKSIFRWRGSVWKTIWRDLFLWLVAYYSIKVLFAYGIPKQYQENCRSLIRLFDSFTTRLPLEFLLGFYVTTVVNRWWAQVIAMPSPCDPMTNIVAFIHGIDEESHRIRHVVARYLVLYYALNFRTVSSRLKEFFPNNNIFVEIGLLTQEEKEIIENSPKPISSDIPLQWVTELVRSKVGCPTSLMTSLSNQRFSMVSLAKHHIFNIPLVYTQTVTIAVYGYFIFCLIGHQFYEPSIKIDTIVPFLTILRFIFGVGWLKVAQDLSKPFGTDDDDIDLCAFLSDYCSIVFATADYVPAKRPLKSWQGSDSSQYEKLKSCFQDKVTPYEACGKRIAAKLKILLSCKRTVAFA